MTADGSARVRILAVSSFFPLPVDRGDPLRVLQLLDAVARDERFSLTVVVVKRPETTADLVAELEERLGVPLIALDRPVIRGGTRAVRALTWGRALVQRTPNWILERSPRSLRRTLASADADVVWYLGEAAARYRPVVKSGEQVWDKANVLGASASETWVGRRLRSRVAALTARGYEGRLLPRMDRVVVTNDTEAARLRELYGRVADAIMPSTVAPPATAASNGRGSRRVGWMGNLDYTPNADGLAVFLESAWPALAAEGFALEIAGPGTPSPRVIAALSKLATARHIGFVDDLDEWMRTLACAVVPLWAGGGTKLKTLTLLAGGVPVVGTPDAFEGIAVVDTVSAFVAGAPADFVESVQAANALGAKAFGAVTDAARAVVTGGFDPQKVATAYADSLFIWAREG